MTKIYTQCLVCKTSRSPEYKTLVTRYIPWARTWSEIVVETLEIILALSQNSHNPSSFLKSGIFSPAQLRASFPGVWSRLHTILSKPLHRLFFLCDSWSVVLSFKTARNSSRPYCFISPTAPRHPSSPRTPATSLLSPAIHPEAWGPRGTNHQLWVDTKPTTAPPLSDRHIKFLDPTVIFKSFFHPKLWGKAIL